MDNQYTKFSHAIKAIFNQPFILSVARKVGFTNRLRTLHPANLIAAMIQSLGCEKHANLTDVLRTLNAKFQEMDNYKPFHNQLKKPELTKLFQSITETASKKLLLEPFKAALPTHYPFKNIHLHDGSSLTLHEKLKEIMPGRFTKTAPAAIELHLTLDLVAGTANYIGLDPDKESEKHHRPYANDLKETLVLMDAGFFDINYCKEINEYKGFYLIRASNSINPNVLAYEIAGSNQVVDCHLDNESRTRTKLKDIKSGKDCVVDYKVQWLKHSDAAFRLIAFWDRKSRRKGYLITNLPAEQFNALEVLNLYGLRWQVELFFKEMKSYCSFKKINTGNENIVKSFIWASVLTLMLKRYVAFSVALMNHVMISTQKVARSSKDWFPDFIGFVFKQDSSDVDTLERIFKYLTKWAQRSHPDRDSKTILYQIGLKLYGCTAK